MLNKEYNLKLDLQFRCNNSKMIFDEFDENTSDFFMQITRQGKEIDISNVIPTLLVLKPSGVARSQILEVKNNIIYGNLDNSLKDEVGTYIAKLMLIEGDKKAFISNISYEVTENALLGKIDNDIVEDERYSILLQLLERLANIELQEQARVDNENSRIESENLRKESIEKIKNDIDNLINETKEELNEYKNNKDISINNSLKEFKEEQKETINTISSDIETLNKTVNNIISQDFGGGGINPVAKALLIEILKNAVYTSDQSQNIKELENSLPNSNSNNNDNIELLQGVLTINSLYNTPVLNKNVLTII